MSARRPQRKEAGNGLLTPRWPSPEDIVAHLFDALGEPMSTEVRAKRKALAELTSTDRHKDRDAIYTSLVLATKEAVGPFGEILLSKTIHSLAWRADTLGIAAPLTGIPASEAEMLIRTAWAPFLQQPLRLALRHLLDTEDSFDAFIRAPLDAWLAYMTATLGLSEEEFIQLLLEEKVKGDPLARLHQWRKDGRIGDVSARTVRTQLATGYDEGWFKLAEGKDAADMAERGALLFAVARGLSHLPSATWREALREPGAPGAIDDRGEPWAQHARTLQIKRQGARLPHLDLVLGSIWSALKAGERDPQALREMRIALRRAIEDLPSPGKRDFAPFLSWIDGEFAARTRGKDAGSKFDAAMQGFSMRGGPIQQELLWSALLQAVHHGDLARTKRLWSCAQAMGVEPMEERLDAVHKRLAIAAEKRFGPMLHIEKGDHRRRVDSAVIPEFTRAEVERIMEAGAAAPNDLHVVGEGRGHRYSPLMLAAITGSLEHVRRLLDAGGDPGKIVPVTNTSALTQALAWRVNAERFGREDRADAKEALRLMLERLSPIDRKNDPEGWNVPCGDSQERPLMNALRLFDPEVVVALIDKGVPLCDRSKSSRAECLRGVSPVYALLQARAMREPVSQNEAQRQLLTSDAPQTLFETRLGAGSEYSLNDVRASMASSLQVERERKIFELVSKSFQRPLNETELHGFHQIMKLLLEHGADPEQRSATAAGELWPPLHFAAEKGWTEAMEILLAHGADPLASIRRVDGSKGPTAWTYASTFGGKEAVKLLRWATGSAA